jgi:hypothetical protein
MNMKTYFAFRPFQSLPVPAAQAAAASVSRRKSASPVLFRMIVS